MCMDEMPSAEFRRRYAGLSQPVTVTVNGHPIGVWTPNNAITLARMTERMEPTTQSFNSRPFTPVPKRR